MRNLMSVFACVASGEQVQHRLPPGGEGTPCICRRPRGTVTEDQLGYLGAEPQLAGQVVVADLLGELDTEVPRGSVLGDACVHDLVNDVQHVVLKQKQGGH